MHIKAKRSVIIKRVDSHILVNSDSDITSELNARNELLDVVDVYKFVGANILKVTFSNQVMASRCIEKGLKMFNLFVPPADIHQEEYYNVKMCYRCFALDSHFTHQCTKPSNYKICSNCSGTDHTFRTCVSSDKRCLHCDGSHSAISFACPERKAIVQRMKASNAKAVIPDPLPVQSVHANPWKNSSPPSTGVHVDQMVVVSVVCLVVSSARDLESPGCFKQVLAELQSANGVPNFKMGNVELPDFRSLLNASPATVAAMEGLSGSEIRVVVWTLRVESFCAGPWS